jgi:cell division protease FtsH
MFSGIRVSGDAGGLASQLAKLTPGFVGADIANVVNEAALRAASLNRSAVFGEDLSWAVDRHIMGVGKDRRPTPRDLEVTAVHEVRGLGGGGLSMVCGKRRPADVGIGS